MITSYLDIGLFYLVTIVVFICVFLFGHVFWSVFFGKDEDAVFQKICVGLIGLPTIYAIYRTTGVTVLWGNLVVFLMYLVYKPKLISFNGWTLNYKKLFPSILFLSLAYFALTFSFWNHSEGTTKVLDGDYAFYSKVGAYLRELGNENIYLEYYLPELRGVSPYHYTELWFTALFSEVFEVHAQIIYGLTFFSVIYTGIYAGVIKLMDHLLSYDRSLISRFKYLIAICFFFVAPFQELYPSDIAILKQDLWTSSLLRMPKLSYIYLLLLWAVLQLLEKKYISLIIIVSLLAISYLTVAPALFTGVGLLTLYLGWQERSILWSIKLLVPLLITTIFVGGFYTVNTGSTAHPIMSGGEESVLIYYNSVPKLKTIINIYGKTAIQIVLTGLPYLLVIGVLILKKRLERYDLLVAPITVLVALGIWSALYWMHDSVQLWSNLHMPIVNILYFSVCILLFRYQVKWVNFLSLLLLFSSVGLNFHEVYRLGVDAERNKLSIENGNTVYYRTNPKYTSVFSKMEQVYQGRILNLALVGDYIPTTCLSVHNIPLSNSSEKAMKEATTFHLYHQLLNEHDSVSIEEAQIQFIIDKDIRYLLVDQNQLPEQFEELFGSLSIAEIDSYFVYERK